MITAPDFCPHAYRFTKSKYLFGEIYCNNKYNTDGKVCKVNGVQRVCKFMYPQTRMESLKVEE